MGGVIAFFVASMGKSVALSLAKHPNHRTLPEALSSIKAIPNANHLILHPMLAEAMLGTYGKRDSPELNICVDRRQLTWEAVSSPVVLQTNYGIWISIL